MSNERRDASRSIGGQARAWVGAIALVLAATLVSCAEHDDDGGSPSGAPLSKTGPTLADIGKITSQGIVTISGKALKPDSAIRIEGGIVTVEVGLGKGKKFSGDVELVPNKVNHLLVTELFDAGGTSPGVPVDVTQDSQPPKVFIDFPADGEVLSTGTTTVAGRVSDLLGGFLGLTVDVNGIAAVVDPGIGTNGTFTITGVFLEQGIPTVITAQATDAVGNAASASISLTVKQAGGDQIETVSGDGQAGEVGGLLPVPLLVEVTHADGSAFAGKVVTFEVTKSNGRLTTNGAGDGALTLTTLTDPSGVAQAYWRLGSDAGCGNNRVTVSSNDIAGAVHFCASAFVGPPKQINVGTGGNQVARVTGPAPELLRAWVSDGCNGVGGVPVTFHVTQGTGKLSGGGKFDKSSVTVLTSTTGHAEATLTLGAEVGNALVRANFEGSGVPDAVFNVFGLAAEQPVTTFTGQVFDNALQPIAGVTCTLLVGTDPAVAAVTNLNGAFLLDGIASSGLADLIVDGGTATHLGGEPIDPAEARFPALHYEPIVIPGATNTLTRPVLLPALNPVNDRSYDGSADVELTVQGIEGLRMVVKAGSLTLPDGTHPTPSDPLPVPITVALNQVHHDDVPMPMPDGAAPPFAWTLQPAGATFDPPVQISYPNMTGLPAGAVSYFLSFNHDTGKFEIVASGHVTADGSCIESDPGSGITVAGWGCNCPPYSVTGECEADCPLDPETTVGFSGATKPASCACDPAKVQSKKSLLTKFASNVLSHLAPDAFALLTAFLGSGGTASYGPGDSLTQRLSGDGGFLLMHLGKMVELQAKAKAVLGSANPSVADYPSAVPSFLVGAVPTNYNLLLGIGSTQPGKSSLTVSNITIEVGTILDTVTATFNYVIGDTYEFDGIGSEDPWLAKAGQYLQECGEAFPVNVSMTYSTTVTVPIFGIFDTVSPDGETDNPLSGPISLSVGSQTTLLAATDSWSLANIQAADAFGASGPGSSPDFISDNAVRAVVLYGFNPPIYLYSEPFKIQQGAATVVTDWTPTLTPPPSPLHVALTIGDAIIAVGEQAQGSVEGTLGDGSIVDLTSAGSWTTYSTSSIGIATVDESGVVKATGPGTAYITATNEGATSVAKVVVTTSDDPLTTIVGFVKLEDGTLVGGATISVVGLPQETTSLADGSYALVDMPTVGIPEYTIRAVAEIKGEFFLGTEPGLQPVPGGLTDAGVIVLGETGGFGPVILSGMDPEDHGAGVGGQGWQMIQDILRFVVEESVVHASPSKILQLGGSVSNLAITQSAVGPLGFTVTHATGAAISTVDFLEFDCLYMPTSAADVSGGLTQADLNLINQREADIIAFINAGGGSAAFAQNLANGYSWFPLDGLTTSSPTGSTITLTTEGQFILSPSATSVLPFHTAFTGPPGFFGLDVLALEGNGQMLPLIIGGIVVLPSE